MAEPSSNSKIKAPAAKTYDIQAAEVWRLLEFNQKTRNEIDRKIRTVWGKHLGNRDEKFSTLPRDLLDRATQELMRELPDIFDKCEGTWFATWALFNRHKGRFRERARRPTLSLTPQGEGSENGAEEQQDIDEGGNP